MSKQVLAKIRPSSSLILLAKDQAQKQKSFDYNVSLNIYLLIEFK